jgi:hypothetical protein
MNADLSSRPQRIAVFQQNGSGERKIAGIRRYGRDRYALRSIDLPAGLPPVIDDAALYLPAVLDADLVLDYLTHPDLSHDLAARCSIEGVPYIGSGKKHLVEGVLMPVTCCALTHQEGLGHYGRDFGMPRLAVRTENGRIAEIRVERGAPCGATWPAAEKMIGRELDEAVVRIGVECQFHCSANPAGWDPIYQKSPVHVAGDLHSAALKAALARAGVKSGGRSR